MRHPVTTLPTTNPLNYRHCGATNFEILLMIANRYCRRNARFAVLSSPHRKLQKWAARVLIHPGSIYDTSFDDDPELRIGLLRFINIAFFALLRSAMEGERVRQMAYISSISGTKKHDYTQSLPCVTPRILQNCEIRKNN